MVYWQQLLIRAPISWRQIPWGYPPLKFRRPGQLPLWWMVWGVRRSMTPNIAAYLITWGRRWWREGIPPWPELDLLSGAVKVILGVDVYHSRVFQWSSEVKVVKFSPRGLFPTNAWPKVTWISTIMALLVINIRFGKYTHTFFNLVPAVSSKHIISWIKCRLWLQTPFWSWLSRNNDSALEDIIVKK